MKKYHIVILSLLLLLTMGVIAIDYSNQLTSILAQGVAPNPGHSLSEIEGSDKLVNIEDDQTIGGVKTFSSDVVMSGNLSVDGAITGSNGFKVGDSSLACDSSTEGMIKYNACSSISICDGSSWKNIDNSFIDPRDNQVYSTIAIGNQCWMAKNLAYLPEVHSNTEFTTASNNEEVGYGVYGYDGSDIATAKASPDYVTYGVYYNWWAAINACPSGWHLPTNTEFSTLRDAVGYYQSKSMLIAGGSSGFNALLAGNRSIFGSFLNIDQSAKFWSSTVDPESEPESDYARFLYLGINEEQVLLQKNYKRYGYTVRCLKD